MFLRKIFRFLVPFRRNPELLLPPRTLRLDFLDWLPCCRSWVQNSFLKRLGSLLPYAQRQRHIFCVGRTGSGKTETLKALALLTKRQWRTGKSGVNRSESLIVLDPHGDFAEELALQRMYAHDFAGHPKNPDLIYIAPHLGVDDAEIQSMLPVLNPFDIWDKGYSEGQIAKHAQQLTRVLQNLTARGDAGLSRNMETLLIPCITVLLKRGESTLLDLQRFLMDNAADLVALGKKSSLKSHRQFFRQSFHSKRFDATKMAIFTRIQSFLNHSTFYGMITGKRSSIDLDGAINSGTSIIVNCSQGRLGPDVTKALGSFLVGMIVSIVLNRAENPSSRRTPTWLMIDEMQHFISPEMKTILTEARKYGLSLTLATQVVGQDINRSFSNIVLGNTAVKIVGSSGLHTRQVMAKEMDLQAEDLWNLETGQFLLKAGNRRPARVRMSTSFLSASSSYCPVATISARKRKHLGLMSSNDWEELVRWQLSRYYVPMERAAPESSLEDENTQLTEDRSNEFPLPNWQVWWS